MSATNRFLEYLGTRSNLAGSVTTIVAVGSTVLLDANPVILVVAGVAGYFGGFFLAKPSQDLIEFSSSKSDEEAATEENIHKLAKQMHTHRGALPDAINSKVDGILDTLTDILPHWKSMASFEDQKFVVNSIITDYLPNTLNSYLALPKSYLARNKRDTESRIIKQLDILQMSLNEIQDNVYAGVERKIEDQGRFLEERFTKNDTLKLAGS